MNLVKTIHRPTDVQINLQTSLFNIFTPIRQYLKELEICNAELAHLICRIIPSQCFRGITLSSSLVAANF